MKIAENKEKARESEQKFEGLPHGYLQWRNIYICMDFHCECGELSHIDGEHLSNVHCTYCGRLYHCNPNIELIEINGKDNTKIIKGQETLRDNT
jgi:hypothetical protein